MISSRSEAGRSVVRATAANLPVLHIWPSHDPSTKLAACLPAWITTAALALDWISLYMYVDRHLAPLIIRIPRILLSHRTNQTYGPFSCGVKEGTRGDTPAMPHSCIESIDSRAPPQKILLIDRSPRIPKIVAPLRQATGLLPGVEIEPDCLQHSLQIPSRPRHVETSQDFNRTK
jgi:hypothetical protein